jgi:hypothetical protein
VLTFLGESHVVEHPHRQRIVAAGAAFGEHRSGQAAAVPRAVADEVLQGLGEVGLDHHRPPGGGGDRLHVLAVGRFEQPAEVGPEPQELVGPVEHRPQAGDVGLEVPEAGVVEHGQGWGRVGTHGQPSVTGNKSMLT